MILNLTNILKYKSIITTIAETGHPIYSSLFMDFKNEVAYFSNPSFVGKVEIGVEDEGEDLLDNVFIPVDKLIHLLSRDSSLILDAEGTIHLSTGDTVKLSTTADPSYLPPTFDLSQEPSLNTTTITEFAKVASLMKQGIVFASAEPEHPQNGIFFRNGSIVAAESSRMFQTSDLTNLPEGSFSATMARLMISCQNEDELTISTTDNIIQMTTTEGLTVQTGAATYLDLVDISDPGFIEAYDHPTTVKINREEFLSELNFISPFFNQEHNQRVKLSFEEDALLLVVDEEDKVTTKVKDVVYSDFSEFDSEIRWISGYYLKLIMSTLSSEFVTMTFNKESPIMDFKDDSTTHILKVAFADLED